MGTCYCVYVEANIDGRWYSLCPYFKGKDGKYKADCLFEAKSVFYEVHLDLQSRNIGWGIPDDISEGLQEVFHEDLDAKMDSAWGDMTWREYYQRSVYMVNFAQAIVPRINKDKPFKYEGYVLKRERAAFEVYEIDEFPEWLTEEEYAALSVREKRQYVFHRWNEPYGEYWIYMDLYQKVRALCNLFQQTMQTEISGSLWDGITDSQVRLYVYFG